MGLLLKQSLTQGLIELAERKAVPGLPGSQEPCEQSC